MMLEADQFVGAAAMPLNVTVLVPFVDPKFAPAIVTTIPAAPVVGDRLAIDGAVVAGTMIEASRGIRARHTHRVVRAHGEVVRLPGGHRHHFARHLADVDCRRVRTARCSVRQLCIPRCLVPDSDSTWR